MIKVLSIDDCPEIQALINMTFTPPEYNVEFAGTLAEAKSRLEDSEFDAILIDITLPDGDGLKFYAELKMERRFSNTPVFIISGKNTIQEKSLGFHLGIEDFIPKPFDPAELKLRVESRIRKLQKLKDSESILVVGNLSINPNTQSISVGSNGNESTIKLSSTEFRILFYLASNKDSIKTRDQIMTSVWGNSNQYSDRTIDSHISRLRKKIQGSTHSIEAAANLGYVFSVRE